MKFIEILKQVYKSRSVKAALLLSVITALEIHFEFLATLLPAQYRPWAIMVWPTVMLFFRLITKEALMDKP